MTRVKNAPCQSQLAQRRQRFAISGKPIAESKMRSNGTSSANSSTLPPGVQCLYPALVVSDPGRPVFIAKASSWVWVVIWAFEPKRPGKPNEVYDDRAISSHSEPTPRATATRASTRRKLVAAPLAWSCFDRVWSPGIHLAGPDARGAHFFVGRLCDRRRWHRPMGSDIW